MTPHPDQRYIVALCKGESKLISEIYGKYSREVQIWVTRNNGDADDAQDLLQDSLMAIYDRYCGRDFQLSVSFGALLMAICRRKWFDRISQKKREESVRNSEAGRYTEETPEWEAAEEAVLQQKRQECLSQVFELLSEQCRNLLSLISEGQMPVDDIARQLGLTNANALYQSKHRCTARWRSLFYEHFKEETNG